LNADDNLLDITMDKPVSWAQELFVNKHNLDAYACLWFDLDDSSTPRYEDQKHVRQQAVWRETLRLMGRLPYVNITVPPPESWGSTGPTATMQESEAATVSESNMVGAMPDKPLATRERNALLAIIAALCKETKLDYTKPSKTAKLIQSMADQMGVTLGETTIENHLKKIPDALETRTR